MLDLSRHTRFLEQSCFQRELQFSLKLGKKVEGGGENGEKGGVAIYLLLVLF